MAIAERIFLRETHRSFGQHLIDRGCLVPAQLLQANAGLCNADSTLADGLVADGVLSPQDAQAALADWLGLQYLAADALQPDPDLLRDIDPRLCLKHAIVPLWREGGVIYVATCRPHSFDTDATVLPQDWQMLQPVLATEQAIQTCIAQQFRDELTTAASARVPDHESCRGWGRNPRARQYKTLALIAVAASAAAYAPKYAFLALVLWTCMTLIVATVMKSASMIAHFVPALFRRATPEDVPMSGPRGKRPRVSILVPLFREREVARALVQRLSRLTYPNALLDVVLVLEEKDTLTQDALQGAVLPSWMRIVVVPDGAPKTKPRAMNYALDFCRGDIIGIYDAEDAPDPDQIDRVAARFLDAPPDMVCLQGVLDYYNPRHNWLARCFTVEYATWFRVMMPGMARLGFAIPLGGTTLFFRRDALEKLGGWDAHNVTEDADLGFRLARHGYRTEMLATTTGEEANCRTVPWIKQRSRWLKGYMVTYLVHMRAPMQLLRQLGVWRFLGFQAHFITALSQFLLAPLLWSFWLIFLGLPHPLNGVVTPELLRAAGWLFLTVEGFTMIAGLSAVAGPKHRHLMKWVPTLHFYFPLGVFAAYKALYELVFQPFYWDKTQHGHSLPESSAQKGRAGGIELQPGHEGL
ncbi:glycosyltransferase [Thalassovita taeanensis]|uniref:Type II secretion system protein GspE N-terminal domain-containing protein n=1 Tax=Thalassovita taeanensis TaxID=657014 RepID=A0A1H9EVL6_9RHOB|nr:glycosyltransferase [Thalassovita taeanensis]SEQ29669.1 hypothetical protein SAMN04488092_105186 [Thalassovita taeanensis]